MKKGNKLKQKILPSHAVAMKSIDVALYLFFSDEATFHINSRDLVKCSDINHTKARFISVNNTNSIK